MSRDVGMTLTVHDGVTAWPVTRQGTVNDTDPPEERRVDVEPLIRLEPRAGASTAPSTPVSIERARAFVADMYEQHQREVHSFALHSTHSVEAAEDVTQETFLRLVHEVSSGRIPDNVRAWLYRVASNLVISRGRRQTVAGRWLRSLARQDVTYESPDRITIGRESQDALRAALADLPRETRVALLMAAQGFSGREIGEAIGRSEQATRTMLCRARLRLRDRLEGTIDRG